MKIEGSLELKCKRYFFTHQNRAYEIDVITGKKIKEFHLRSLKCGDSLYMFGIPAITRHPDEYFINQAPDYIEHYWEMVESLEEK